MDWEQVKLKLQETDWRRTLTQNQNVVMGVAIAVILVALGAIGLQLMPASRSFEDVEVHFYDLGSGELFAASSSEIPPIQAPSDRGANRTSGVKAFVFACGDCSDEDDQFIGYLQVNPPELKALLIEQREQQMQSGGDLDEAEALYIEDEQEFPQPLIRRVTDETWAEQDSEEANAIVEDVVARCPEGDITLCLP